MNYYGINEKSVSHQLTKPISESKDKGHFFQPKLTVGPVDDVYEREADNVAENVMQRKFTVQKKISSVDAVQKKCAGCDKGEEIQRKGQRGNETSTLAPQIVSDAIGSSGNPLDAGTRSFMESRFGYDFSNVKIHTGSLATKSAEAINARAYTSGNSIVFREGQYNPYSNEGKHLLAHELTHVVQQSAQGQRNVQRMVEVNEGVTLNTHGYSVTRTGNFYLSKGVSKSSVWNEIITGLFFSDRIFKIKGSTNAEADENFMKHVKARYGVIEFAAKKKYKFGAGVDFKMNPDFWNVGGITGYDVKAGKDKQKAMDDLNVHPEKYAIACLAATTITMVGGGKSPFLIENNVETYDWIPGDWGYIENTKFPTGGRVGMEGENIIYVGLDKYWGHFSDDVAYKTLKGWFDEVYDWNKGAVITDVRKYPTMGLEY